MIANIYHYSVDRNRTIKSFKINDLFVLIRVHINVIQK